jgi:hypothetical protein
MPTRSRSTRNVGAIERAGRSRAFRKSSRTIAHLRHADYDAASGTVTVPPGRTSWVACVTVRGDRKREPDEVFYVSLSHPNGATIADGRGAASIRN